MAPACLSSLGNLLLGAGLGILAVSCLAATIMFGKFCTTNREDLRSYSLKNPNEYTGSMVDSATCAAIFGCLAAAAAIGAIVVAGLLAGQKIILIALGGATAAFTLACIISEGMVYHYDVAEYVRSSTGNHYINSSRARNYIKDSLKDLYEQALSNFKDQNQNVDDLYSWDDIEKLIGKGYEKTEAGTTTTVYPNYPDLWGGSIYDFEKDSTKNFIYFSVSGSFIMAHAEGKTNSIVASLAFNYSDAKAYHKWYYFCWSTSKTEYECDSLEDEKTFTPFGFVNFRTTPFTLSQYFTIDDAYVSNLKRNEDQNKPYYLKYALTGFPVAFRLMSNADIIEYNRLVAAGNNNAGVYEEDTNHYRFSAESYVKAAYNVAKDNADDVEDDNKISWCNSKPSSVEDAFSYDQTTNVYKCYPTHLQSVDTISVGRFGSLGEYQYITATPAYPFFTRYSDAKQPLSVAFENTVVGKYPSFLNSYYRSNKNDNIFLYTGNHVTQFAIASLIIQICGILLWAAGAVPGFLGSD